MKVFTAFSLPLRRLATRRPWTCSNCRGGPLAQQSSRAQEQQQQRFSNTARGFSSTTTKAAINRATPKTGGGKKGGRVWLLASGGGAATAGVLAFGDDIKYGYDAAERAGRVAAALAVCINEYGEPLTDKHPPRTVFANTVAATERLLTKRKRLTTPN